MADTSDEKYTASKAGKPPLQLLNPDFVEQLAGVLQFGEQKHRGSNWREGVSYEHVAAAAQRHMNDFLRGISKDPETGMSPLVHAAACCMILFSMEQLHCGIDDRRWSR